ALVQDGAADELYVEVPHVERAAARLAHDREGLRQQLVERFAVLEALAKLDGLPAELLVGQRRDRWLEGVHLRHDRAQTFQFAFVLGADDFGEERIEHLQLGIPRQEYPSIVTHKAGRQSISAIGLASLNSCLAAFLLFCLASVSDRRAA